MSKIAFIYPGQGAQKAGVRIRQKVEVTGSGKVQFFCNNKMVEEKNL